MITKGQPEDMSWFDSDVVELFTNMVVKQDYDPTACWIWNDRVNGNASGFIQRKGKMISAGRISWAIYHSEEPIIKGLRIAHRADTCLSYCVHPDHLFQGSLGSVAPPLADADRKIPPSPAVTPEEIAESLRVHDLIAGFLPAADGDWTYARKFYELGLRTFVQPAKSTIYNRHHSKF